MKQLIFVLFFLSMSFFAPVRGFAHSDHYHPYHSHSSHYRGGYVYCSVCHLYHGHDHHHFRRHQPVVVEHHTEVQRQIVTETQEVVE